MNISERVRLKYAEYISNAIAAGATELQTLDQFNQALREPKGFSVMRWSEKLQAYFTFPVEAQDQHTANCIAAERLKAFEAQHTLERDGKKILTEAEQKAKLIREVERAMKTTARVQDSEEQKRAKLLKFLSSHK